MIKWLVHLCINSKDSIVWLLFISVVLGLFSLKEIKNPSNSAKQLIDFLTLLQDSKQLTVTNVRTLKMTEDVLAVSISPEGKHIAVALLDCHVKVAL